MCDESGEVVDPLVEDHPGMVDLVENFLTKKGHFHLEGERGVVALSGLVEAIGYGPTDFKYGSAIEVFLVDNPGAQTALCEWIADQEVDEWSELLQSELDGGEE